MIRALLAYLVAVIVTYITGAFFASQNNLSQVAEIISEKPEIGLSITFSQRLDAAFHDITHMVQSYLPLIAVAFLIAFPVSGLLSSMVAPRRRGLFYVLAGFVAVITLHISLKAAFDVWGVAATRTLSGLITQGLCGLLGGYIFHRMTHGAFVERTTKRT